MKQIFITLCLTLSLMLVSCEGTTAQVLVGADYPTYVYYESYTNRPVIYISGLPYYRYYYGGRWCTELVPVHHRHYIVRHDSHITHRPPVVHRNQHYTPNHYNRHQTNERGNSFQHSSSRTTQYMGGGTSRGRR